MKKISNKQKLITLMVAIVLLGATGLGIWRLSADKHLDDSPTATQTIQDTADIATPPEKTEESAVASQTKSQNDMLAYLIEEEKLAHDVYTVMFNTYGARVFGNILNSEQTHQSKVLTLLSARNLSDPRVDEVGKFTNTDLQDLYNKLIEQGLQSPSEAYKVGVAIEELDIADITKQLATATDTDIVSTLESLRNGSENHLRAFNRQLGNY